MGDTQGTAENPIYVGDFGASTVGSRVVAYLSLDDDGGSTERPLEELPAASRTANRRRHKHKRNSNGASALRHRQGADSATRDSIHSPSVEPVMRREFITIDDDEPEAVRRASPQRSITTLPSPYPFGRTNRLVPQGIGAIQATDSDQKPSHSPIGDRADSGREQTLSRRVGADATSTPMRVDNNAQEGKLTTLPRVLDEARGSGEVDVPRTTLKPRAVKRAKSPPQRKPDSERSTREESKNHADSPDSVPVPNRHTNDRPQARARELDKRLSQTVSGQHKKTTLTKQARNTLPGDAVADIGRIDMGAQASTPKPGISNAAVFETLNEARTSSHTPSLLTPDSPEAEVRHTIEEYLACPEITERRVLASQIQLDALTDVVTARQGIEKSLKHHLDGRREDHAYLVKNALQFQRTCFAREKLPKVSREVAVPTHSRTYMKYSQSASPFNKMQSIQTPYENNVSKETLYGVTQEIFNRATPKHTVTKSSWNVPTTVYAPQELEIPSFREYVSLKTSMLADNESKLLSIPWLGDDGPPDLHDNLLDDLPKMYEIRHDINPFLDLRNEQCQFYFNAVESFLTEVGTTWDSMLFWLLSSDKALRRINQSSDRGTEFEHVLLDRSGYDTEAFNRRMHETRTAVLFERGPDRWRDLLRQLGKPSAVQLRLTALASSALMSKCGFTPWYMANKSITMQEYVSAKTKNADRKSSFVLRSIVCRICHEHNCVFHGQIREAPESDSASTSGDESMADGTEQSATHNGSQDDRSDEDPLPSDSDDSDDEIYPAHYDSDDSDLEKLLNYKFPVNPDVPTRITWEASAVPEHALPPPGLFKPRWWETKTNTAKWEQRTPFVPCSHPGDCVEANCRCFRENITCEKTCKCSQSCNRRFPGCRCVSTPGKRTCGIGTSCLCSKFQRECDADICGSCGATELLDPVNRYNEELLKKRCNNIGLQRGVPKKTLLGKSEVHGFGLYAGQDIREDDVVGEYTGEILSVGESERREVIYHYEQNMYLFRLNQEQEVDATHMGNKLRFINNANQNLSNCHSRVVFCNTVFRVALYASVDIKAGQELFFHYNYPESMTKNFKQPKGKVVAVKQTVKAPSKVKQKRPTSASSDYDVAPSSAVVPPDRPLVRAALAKARAAKAEKRAAMLAEKAAMATTALPAAASTLPGKKFSQARKSAVGPLLDVRGPSKRARELDIEDDSAESRSASRAEEDVSRKKRRTPNLVVQDSDDDGEEAVPHNATEGASDSEDGVSGTGLRRTRRSHNATGSASVFAIKKINSTNMGGARPGAGRKRKRPLALR